MSDVFECEIQARLRDINLGGHVDNVEAIRILDEARTSSSIGHDACVAWSHSTTVVAATRAGPWSARTRISVATVKEEPPTRCTHSRSRNGWKAT